MFYFDFPDALCHRNINISLSKDPEKSDFDTRISLMLETMDLFRSYIYYKKNNIVQTT